MNLSHSAPGMLRDQLPSLSSPVQLFSRLHIQGYCHVLTISKKKNTATKEIQIHTDTCIYKELGVMPGPLPMGHKKSTCTQRLDGTHFEP